MSMDRYGLGGLNMDWDDALHRSMDTALKPV